MRKVKLTYFKDSGKYYSEGEYESEIPDDEAYNIYSEVREMNIKANRTFPMPGLYARWSEGYILVEPDNGVPAIIKVYG